MKQSGKSKRKPIPSAVRNNVWNIYVGTSEKEGTCYCCKTERISYANFQCGHVEAHAEGGEVTLQNLRPICAQCNQSMGKTNMTEFMKMYGFDKINPDNFRKIDNTLDDFHEISPNTPSIYPNLKEDESVTYTGGVFGNLMSLFGMNKANKPKNDNNRICDQEEAERKKKEKKEKKDYFHHHNGLEKKKKEKEKQPTQNAVNLHEVPIDNFIHTEQVHEEILDLSAAHTEPMIIEQDDELVKKKVKALLHLFSKETLRNLLTKKGVSCSGLNQDELVVNVIKKTRLPGKVLTLFSIVEIKQLAEITGLCTKNKKEIIIADLLNMDLFDIFTLSILVNVNHNQLQQLKEMLGIRTSMISRRLVQLEILEYFTGSWGDFLDFLHDVKLDRKYVTICCACVVGYGNWKEVSKSKSHYFFGNEDIKVCGDSIGYCKECKKDTTMLQKENRFVNCDNFYSLIDKFEK